MIVSIFSELKFQHYDDPAQSVHEIFAQSRRILSMNGLAELFSKHEDLTRKQIDAIVRCLYPRTLHESVKSRSLDKIDCKKDLKRFYKFLLDTVTQYRQFYNKFSSSKATMMTEKAAKQPSQFNVAQRPISCLYCKRPHHVLSCNLCPSRDTSQRLLGECRQRNLQQSNHSSVPGIVKPGGNYSFDKSLPKLSTISKPAVLQMPSPSSFPFNMKPSQPFKGPSALSAPKIRVAHHSEQRPDTFPVDILLNNPADAIEDLTARLNRMALRNDVSLIESHVCLVKDPPDDYKTLCSVPVARISRVLV
jgi:hypothetical protein